VQKEKGTNYFNNIPDENLAIYYLSDKIIDVLPYQNMVDIF